MPWYTRGLVHRHAERAEQAQVCTVACEGHHEVRRDRLAFAVRLAAHHHVSARDLDHAAAPADGHPALLDAVRDVGQDPRFHPAVEVAQEMHYRHACVHARELERGLDGAVPRAHDHDALLPIGVRLDEEVRHVWQVFAGDAEQVGRVEVAGRAHDVTSADRLRLRDARMPRRQLEALRRALHLHDFVILPHVQLEVIRHAPVVRQRFASRRLVAGGDERDTDLELFGGREERHVQGVALQAGNDWTLVEQRAHEVRALRCHADGEPAGPRTNHRKIEHQSDSVTSLR